MLGEIIVIETNLIDSAIKEENPAANRASAHWKQLNEFHFASLWSILMGVAYSEEKESEIKIITSEDGETWVVSIPMELTELISTREGKDNSGIIEKWSAIEEFQWGWSKNDIEKLFKDLIELSIKAKNSGKALIYWGAL
jgi:hypothetical protein